jgi:hypothetical protein
MVSADAKRLRLAVAAVMAFAAGGLVLSWVSAHVELNPVSVQLHAATGVASAPGDTKG